MGYEIHIKRCDENWTNDRNPIRVEEWDRVVASDPSLEVMDVLEITDPDTGNVLLRVRGERMAKWVPDKSNPDEFVCFILQNGALSLAAEALIYYDEIKEIATKLGANIIGDDGELY
jgi:hypothetical protein